MISKYLCHLGLIQINARGASAMRKIRTVGNLITMQVLSLGPTRIVLLNAVITMSTISTPELIALI